MKFYEQLKIRRDQLLENISVMHFIVVFLLGPLLSMAICVYILFWTSFYPLILGYLIWMYVDRNTCHQNGRSITQIRNCSIWGYFRNYFPQTLVKTADLPPTENYIFCVFPHGLLCSGALAHFIPLNLDFAKKFPDITVSLHSLNPNFYLPFTREYAMALGFLSVSKEALMYQLTKKKGHAVNLIIGGSAEALKSSPGVYRVVLKNRKGFVKMALVTGASLVPVFNFGEVDTYDNKISPEGSRTYKFQQTFRKWTGIAPCILYGRGPFGLLPRRVPVTTVVGKPIPVKKLDNPNSEQINTTHAKFIEELNALFEEHKHKYLKNPESTFLSIED